MTIRLARFPVLPMIILGIPPNLLAAPFHFKYRWNGRYLLLAGALPMLAVTLGTVLNRSELAATYLLPGALGFGGLAGFVLAIRFFQPVQHDPGVLKQAARRSSDRLERRQPVPSSESATANCP
jgi:hypothetical protein